MKRLLEKSYLIMYNIISMDNIEKQFNAEYLDEAITQLRALSSEDRCKILEAINTFELVGVQYKNLNNLGDGLYEIKPKGVRAYFMYNPNRRKIIIVGFVALKKTQKAPKRYIEIAKKLILAYIEQEQKDINK